MKLTLKYEQEDMANIWFSDLHYLINVYSIFNPNKIRIHIYVVNYIRYHCTLIRFDQAPIATTKV